jgi:hypothetical protein
LAPGVVVLSHKVRAEMLFTKSGQGDAGAITATAVHGLALEDLVREAIGTIAAFIMITEKDPFDFEPPFVTRDEVRTVKAAALGARRGRPVGDESLRRFAEVVRANPVGYVQAAMATLHISERTFWRYRKKAQERGFLTEEEG